MATVLSIVARIRPQAWDAIIPHGPLVRERLRVSELAALNPQPLPPAEAFTVAAAEMAHHVALLAIEAEVAGGSSSRSLADFVDDWCGTSWPRKWPWPFPGPRRDELDADLLAVTRMVGAIVFASYGSRLGEGDLGGTFTGGAEKLAEVAVSG